MTQSKRILGVVLVCVLLLGGAAWFSFGRVRAQSGEGQLDIPLVCASCGHSLSVDFDGLARFISEASQKGLTNPGSGQAPIGFCPKCGKPTLYRAEEDAQTGKPVLPNFARNAAGPTSEK